MKAYKRLNQIERDHISVGINRGDSLRLIARDLGRSVGSISREIHRNNGKIRYRPSNAQKCAELKQQTKHVKPRLKNHALRLRVEELLYHGYSPEIISGSLKLQSALARTNTESIYQWIYSDAPHLVGTLVRAHRKRWPKGKCRRGKFQRIPERVSIQQRPEHINNRSQIGHWESDLVVGKGRAALQVLVERKSRFTFISKIDNKTAAVNAEAISSLLAPLPEALRQTITYDNGGENVLHSQINQQLQTDSFFCEPYHSWEKGTVENTNGLLRRFWPKKTNFDTLSFEQIRQVQDWLNHRPRKCLNFYSPADVFNP